MANSQGTERKRLTMVIKTSAYKIGSKFFHKLPRLKISSKENIGCGYSTKELTGSKQTGNLPSFEKEISWTKKEEQDNTSLVGLNNIDYGLRTAATGSELSHLQQDFLNQDFISPWKTTEKSTHKGYNYGFSERLRNFSRTVNQ